MYDLFSGRITAFYKVKRAANEKTDRICSMCIHKNFVAWYDSIYFLFPMATLIHDWFRGTLLGYVHVLNLDSGMCELLFYHQVTTTADDSNVVISVVLNLEARKLVSLSKDGTTKIWDLPSESRGEPIAELREPMADLKIEPVHEEDKVISIASIAGSIFAGSQQGCLYHWPINNPSDSHVLMDLTSYAYRDEYYLFISHIYLLF
mgnify:CR=1 FL=1